MWDEDFWQEQLLRGNMVSKLAIANMLKLIRLLKLAGKIILHNFPDPFQVRMPRSVCICPYVCVCVCVCVCIRTVAMPQASLHSTRNFTHTHTHTHTHTSRYAPRSAFV